MGKLGKWISGKIQDFIIGTIEAKYGHNIQAQVIAPAGIDSYPLKDDQPCLIPVDDSTGNMYCIGILNKSQGADKGELKLFSRNANGTVKATIYLNKDGKLTIDTDSDIDINSSGKITQDGTEIQFNSGSDFAVRFNELEARLGDLENNQNTLTVDIVGVQAGAATITSSVPKVPSNVDFSNCKVDSIKLPAVGE